MSSNKVAIPKKPFSFLFYLSKPYKKWAILSILSVIFAASASASFPYVFKKIIDTVVNFSEGDSTKVVLFWVLMFPILNLIGGSLWRASALLGSRWITGVQTSGYKKLFTHLSGHSQSFFDNRFAGSLVSKISTATRSAESMIENFLWSYLSAFISLLISIVYAITVKPIFGLMIIILVLILVPFNLYIIKFRRVAAENETEIQNDLKGKTVDVATNMIAVRQFAMIKAENINIGRIAEKLKVAMLKSWFVSEAILSVNLLIIGVFIFVISILTYNSWVSGLITPGDFVLIFTLMSGLLYNLLFIGSIMSSFARRYGEIQNSLEDIIINHEINDSKDAKELKVKEGVISIRSLDFQYEKETVIFENLSLEIPSKQKVGIIGPSGAGKTTFIKLLLRQSDINGGGIYIDDQNIAEVTQDSLHKSIAIVPQEPALFHRTIRENISYGQDELDDNKIIEAAKKAEAHDFIIKLPKGYDTLVGERGVKLSAGQRQRVAIARAILKDSPILILDEATSALDSESEVAIQKALHNLMQKKTVLAIAHRLSTLSEMNRILVIDDGKIVEDGTQQELMKAKGIYTKLWNHQAGGFLTEEE